MIYYSRNGHKMLPKDYGKFVAIGYCEKCYIDIMQETDLEALYIDAIDLRSGPKPYLELPSSYISLDEFLEGKYVLKACPFCRNDKLERSYAFVNHELLCPGYSRLLKKEIDAINSKITDFAKQSSHDPYEKINERLKNIRNEATEKMVSFIEMCEKQECSSNITTSIESVDLKEYLQRLTQLEGTIFTISSRLTDLYYHAEILKREDICLKKLLSLKIKKEINKKERKYKSEKIKYEEEKAKYEELLRLNIPNYLATISKLNKEINIRSIRVNYPKKPTSEVIKFPTEPILSTPHFLFKKRNTLLVEAYEKEWEQATTQKERYINSMVIYIDAVKKAHQERLIKYEEALEEQKKKIENAKREKEEKEKEYSEVIKSLNSTISELEATYNKEKTVSEFPENAHINLVNSEIEQAEQLLKELVIARKELYSFDIIFEKYRNYVAVSTLYEYILSGRCDTLVGSTGAYNLYENEIRMNMVITKLDQVVECLESIKNNQYMLYTSITNMNKELKNLNNTMSKIVVAIETLGSNTLEQLSDIVNSTSIIKNKTSFIAYNTERTAFYSKRNAELTNALGYLVAFK